MVCMPGVPACPVLAVCPAVPSAIQATANASGNHASTVQSSPPPIPEQQQRQGSGEANEVVVSAGIGTSTVTSTSTSHLQVNRRGVSACSLDEQALIWNQVVVITSVCIGGQNLMGDVGGQNCWTGSCFNTSIRNTEILTTAVNNADVFRCICHMQAQNVN